MPADARLQNAMIFLGDGLKEAAAQTSSPMFSIVDGSVIFYEDSNHWTWKVLSSGGRKAREVRVLSTHTYPTTPRRAERGSGGDK